MIKSIVGKRGGVSSISTLDHNLRFWSSVEASLKRPESATAACLCRLPTGHTALLRRWINVEDVDSTSQQRRVPSGWVWLAGWGIDFPWPFSAHGCWRCSSRLAVTHTLMTQRPLHQQQQQQQRAGSADQTSLLPSVADPCSSSLPDPGIGIHTAAAGLSEPPLFTTLLGIISTVTCLVRRGSCRDPPSFIPLVTPPRFRIYPRRIDHLPRSRCNQRWRQTITTGDEDDQVAAITLHLKKSASRGVPACLRAAAWPARSALPSAWSVAPGTAGFFLHVAVQVTTGRICCLGEYLPADPMSVQCWASVADAGPTLYRHWVSVFVCRAGYFRYSAVCVVLCHTHRAIHIAVLPARATQHEINNSHCAGVHSIQPICNGWMWNLPALKNHTKTSVQWRPASQTLSCRWADAVLRCFVCWNLQSTQSISSMCGFFVCFLFSFWSRRLAIGSSWQ